jgi:hypothetical protein
MHESSHLTELVHLSAHTSTETAGTHLFITPVHILQTLEQVRLLPAAPALLRLRGGDVRRHSRRGGRGNSRVRHGRESRVGGTEREVGEGREEGEEETLGIWSERERTRDTSEGEAGKVVGGRWSFVFRRELTSPRSRKSR